ncbi:MAG TPA: efflux RND transporter periplasmic adaptor subunit [Prolixibacteraceae bacterium]|nr:efflux RND transporter periplasmic adaptor subunit [Prolixibacteraceae bacterium]HPR60652.1 efflux RND transporter periplasmic adaptor subunit [Prolixibacteraceae bacterium]
MAKRIPIPVACLIIVFLTLAACNKKNTNEVPVAQVRQGTFFLDIYEEGEIEAINSTNIVSPQISWRYGQLKIIDMVEDGTEVQKGDTLIVFDPSEVRKAIVDAEASLEMKRAELKKLKAEQESAIVELEADLEVTRLSQQISKIEFEAANYEADIRKQEIQLNMERANIALDRAVEQIENRKKIQQEELKQKMLEITQSENQLNEAHETLSRLVLISPSPGIAIITRNWSSDAKFQIGDQCWSGYTLIELPDLSGLKASVQINEVDISKVTKGLKAEVKPDAFSDSVYSAEVMTVANLAINKDRNSKIKVFPVDILISNPGKTLLPGLTVSCRIIIDQIDNVMFIPIEAVHSTPENDFTYVQTASGFEKRDLILGQTNTDYVIVQEGLRSTDKVALIDPFVKDEPQKQ